MVTIDMPHGKLTIPPALRFTRRHTDGSVELETENLSESFTAVVKPDGSITFRDTTPFSKNGSGMSTLGLDDLITQAKSGPPTYQKNKFMQMTEAQRNEMQRRYYAFVLVPKSNGIVRQILNNILGECNGNWPKARQQITELWDECDPTGAAGRSARVLVINFARKHLPADELKIFEEFVNKNTKS